MPLQNRVTPEGEIIATQARGTLMGNRGGMIHRVDKTLSPRRWHSRQWIACKLSYRGRWREVMGPDSYTELFFLDEATSFAAGHRPCYECRRREAQQFAELWGAAHGGGRAKASEIDAILHAERLTAEGRKATVTAHLGTLPTGTLVRHDAYCYLVLARRLLRWSPAGYTMALEAPADLMVDVLTPKSVVEVFRAGYDADVHESALSLV